MLATAEIMLRAAIGNAAPLLDRARAQLLLAETVLLAGRRAEADKLFREAAATLDAAGARYWAVRSYVGLAACDPGHADAWIKRANRLSLDDPAFARLFAASPPLRLEAYGPGRIRCGARPVEFRSHKAERALFLLAFAGPDGMHTDQLAAQLWPAANDRLRLLGRTRTLLWDVRRGLDQQGWRLQRHGPTVMLNLTGVEFDVARTRSAALSALAEARRPRMAEVVEQLRRPLLLRWAYEDWVVDEQAINDALAEMLDMHPDEIHTASRPASGYRKTRDLP